MTNQIAKSLPIKNGGISDISHAPCADILDWSQVTPEKANKSRWMVARLKEKIKQIKRMKPAERAEHFANLTNRKQGDAARDNAAAKPLTVGA